MLLFLYNIISLLLLPLLVIFNIYRSIRLGWPLATGERFGHVSATSLSAIAGRPVVLIHAVSIGEVNAARPLLKALRSRYHSHALVLTSTTETGKSTATTLPEIDLALYFPFDLIPSVRSMLNALKPRMVIVMETEIWPNFCFEVARRHIPLILANGRISERSYPRYLRMRFFFQKPLGCFNRLCMQSDADRERLISIGADPNRTLVVGNLKNDLMPLVVEEIERQKLRDSYSIPSEACVIVAGSTREGEEQYLISAYMELAAEFGHLLLILVPRHPQRAQEVAALLTASGISYKRRSEITENGLFKYGEVLLVDTIGELTTMYRLCDIAFVGGSLVPCGGHNLLEPASAAVPVIFGPHMENFREIEGMMLQYGGGIQINRAGELTAVLSTLITNPTLRRVLGTNGQKMLRDNSGAVERHMAVLAGYL